MVVGELRVEVRGFRPNAERELNVRLGRQGEAEPAEQLWPRRTMRVPLHL